MCSFQRLYFGLPHSGSDQAENTVTHTTGLLGCGRGDLKDGHAMKVILLGTGGPKPDPHRRGPALVIQVKNRYILFDTGRGTATQLVRAGIPLDRVHPICITHHHYDHISDLGDVILSGWNLGRKEPLTLLGPDGTSEILDALLSVVYKKDIDFRMKEADITGVRLADIRKLVTAEEVMPGLVYQTGDYKLFADYVDHGHGLGISRESWKCLGYRIEAEGKSIAVSGDAVDCPGLDRLAYGTDALVMCCYLSSAEIRDHHSASPDGVGNENEVIARHILACSPDVGRIAGKANSRKLILTHFREKSEVQLQNCLRETGAVFDGEIIAGKDLLAIDI